MQLQAGEKHEQQHTHLSHLMDHFGEMLVCEIWHVQEI